MPFINIDNITSREIVPGFFGKMIHMRGMTFSHWTAKAGAELPEHHHVHEQVSYLLKGTLEFTLEGKTEQITPGKLVVIPSHAKHAAKAITDCEIIDVFQPVRQEYM